MPVTAKEPPVRRVGKPRSETQREGTHTVQRETQGVRDEPTNGSRVVSFPEPPRRRRRRRALIGAVITFCVVLLVMVLVIFTPLLQIRTVTVEGTRLAASEQVYLALEPLKGRTLIQVSEADARALLKDLPAVKDVDMVAIPPSTLQVTVLEYIPVAVLEQGKSFVLIDESGRKLGSAKDRASAKLPLIEGGTAAVNSDVFSSVTSVLASLPEEVLSRLKHASAKSVDSVQLQLEDGRRVFWGSADQNEAKAAVLQTLLEEPRSDPPVTEFDVSTPQRPVTRTE